MRIIEDILERAKIPGVETAFLSPPGGVLAVWHESIDADGSDFGNEIYRREFEVELFEPRDAPSPESHLALQRALDGEAIPWRKNRRVFYEDIQYYCTTYSFDVVERIST